MVYDCLFTGLFLVFVDLLMCCVWHSCLGWFGVCVWFCGWFVYWFAGCFVVVGLSLLVFRLRWDGCFGLRLLCGCLCSLGVFVVCWFGLFVWIDVGWFCLF